MKEEQKFAVVILAAGQGKRMGGETPKVLRLLAGQPIISHLVDSVQRSEVCAKPVVVVCDEHTLVQDVLGEACDYVIQAEQLGTAHGVACAEEFLKDQAEHVLVLYGDHAFLSPETLKKLKDFHLAEGNDATLMTTEVADFEDWRAAFLGFGRIIRDDKGEIVGIVENKDADEAQRKILEVNPMYGCFKSDWLWLNLKKINKQNTQGEYYLTDLVELAFEQGGKISSLKIDNWECLGINRLEELALAEELFKKRNNL